MTEKQYPPIICPACGAEGAHVHQAEEEEAILILTGHYDRNDHRRCLPAGCPTARRRAN